ncbi:Ubiquitin carboxyl-terminal hydrolase MIY1 [Candida tropicalis]
MSDIAATPPPLPEASGSLSTANTPQDSVQFPLKLINWKLDSNHDLLSTPILLQEKNGLCPLIALCNTLLLNHDMQTNNKSVSDEDPTYFANNQERSKEISMDNFKSKLINKYHNQGKINLDEVLQYIADLLLVYIEGIEDRFKFTIDEFLSNLPKLHTGLNVNPILYSSEFQQDLDYLLHDDDDDDPQIHQNKEFLSKWLSLNQTQLTQQGIAELNDKLDTNEFIVFFRNNHFNTLFKKSENEFYLLLTDSSFVGSSHTSNKSSQIIWQSLNSVSGNDDLFFTGDFNPVLDIDQDLPNFAPDTGNSDYLLLKQLQEEEDQKLAAGLQKRYDKRKPSNNTKNDSNNTAPPSKSSSSRTNPGTHKLKESTDIKTDTTQKKKKHCIIT